MNITIVRHGETEWNIEKKFQGQGNSNLTALGKEQAEKVSVALLKDKFDIMFSSDLERCRNTALIINKKLNLKLIEDKRIRERNFGVIQGLTKEEIQYQYPDIYLKYITGSINFAVPGGESFSDLFYRVNDFFDWLSVQPFYTRVLIVTHGGVLDCVIRKVMGLSLESNRCFSIYNTSINCISVTEGYWKLETWGNVSHLSDMKTIDDF